MTAFVTGHRGMLGHVVATYLRERGVEVVTSERRYEARPDDPLIDDIRESPCGWIVNALGRIKQKCHDRAALFEANALFPLHVKQRMRRDQRLIHASSDCVFSGRTGSYRVEDEPDATDDYGLSKVLGECVAEAGRCHVIRTSIVGPERGSSAGLMSWFLAQREPVRGFTNHRWNGITTLEWAKICLELMEGRHADRPPLCQPATWPVITKHELLEAIGDAWGHRARVDAATTETSIDRSLVPTLTRAPLREQLSELRRWYHEHVV